MYPEVLPKGKAKKQAAKAHYRTTLIAYVRRCIPVLEGTSGLVRMSITDFNDVRVNGRIVANPRFELKPGDVVQARDPYDKWHTYTVTAEQIEQTWR